MVVTVSRERIIRFRLHAHHLDQRLTRARLLDAAGACGVQDSPPGSALLALHARVRDITADRVDHSLADDKSLLRSWSMRGAPFHFPSADLPVFTTGVLPPTEAALRQFVLGAGPSVDELDLTITEAADLTEAEIRDVLSGRRLPIGELGTELAGRIAPHLTKKQRAVWEREGPHAAGQPVGEAVVHFYMRILTLRQVVCFAPRDGGKAPFVLLGEWLDDPVPDLEPEAARAELLRRYLRCHGPSTKADFAGWLGVRAGDAKAWWDLAGDEMIEVDSGRRTWLLGADLDGLRSAPAVEGVRLLPPRDPYTQARDRATLVDRKHHREVWRPAGDPGTVLVDGEIAGVWRTRKRGKDSAVTVTTFAELPARTAQRVTAEAEKVAALRGAASAEVELAVLG
jgi:hypothetical protein